MWSGLGLVRCWVEVWPRSPASHLSLFHTRTTRMHPACCAPLPWFHPYIGLVGCHGNGQFAETLQRLRDSSPAESLARLNVSHGMGRRRSSSLRIPSGRKSSRSWSRQRFDYVLMSHHTPSHTPHAPLHTTHNTLRVARLTSPSRLLPGQS